MVGHGDFHDETSRQDIRSIRPMSTKTLTQEPTTFFLISVCMLHSLTSNICLSQHIKHIYFREYIVKSCLLIQSDNIFLLFGVFKTFPFNAIIKWLGSICHLAICLNFLQLFFVTFLFIYAFF